MEPINTASKFQISQQQNTDLHKWDKDGGDGHEFQFCGAPIRPSKLARKREVLVSHVSRCRFLRWQVSWKTPPKKLFAQMDILFC